MEEVELRAIFKGRVQGVGFRATARYHALNLGLTGYVRNLPDGSVDLCALGAKSTVEKLLKILTDEVFADCIDSVEITFTISNQGYEDFSVRA